MRPERKAEVLPSVLDSDNAFRVDSGSASATPEVELDMLPAGVGPGDAAQPDYVLMPDAKGEPDFPESKELDPVRDLGERAKPLKKLKSARKTNVSAADSSSPRRSSLVRSTPSFAAASRRHIVRSGCRSPSGWDGRSSLRTRTPRMPR